jgi:putative colanic acid biosynthesis acetyltransferase WcaF
MELSKVRSPYSFRNRIARVLWGLVYWLLFRPTPRTLLWWWRRTLLRLFGARIGKGVKVYSSCRIWGPWNLEMGDYSCLAFCVDCYCAARIRIGANCVVSQYSYLCSATHDPTLPRYPLITAPITIEDHVWVAADVFVGPGVTIGEGAVVGARASVYADVEPWTIVGGNPARFLKKRVMREG